MGGAVAGARNIISGNGQEGVSIVESATGTEIQANFIGTDVSGTTAIANSDDGVDIEADSNVVGGTSEDLGNLISGNGGDGIEIRSSTGNIVQSNAIGLDISLDNPPPNGGDGIEIESAAGTIVGHAGGDYSNVIAGNLGSGVYLHYGSSNTQIEANLIAFNNSDGVTLAAEAGGGEGAGSGNTITANDIYQNSGEGIDLNENGVTANDTGDTDTGPNGLQNFPVLTLFEIGSTHVVGSLNSTASSTFTVEVFSVSSCDAGGYGEGEVYLGSFVTTTNASGNATFDKTLTRSADPSHQLTATATDVTGNTSEFSACQSIDCTSRTWDNQNVSDTRTERACDTLTVGSTVTSTGDLTLEASTVVFVPDVTIGGALTVNLVTP